MTETKRISWIEHKGQRILFGDYSGLKGDELLKVLHESEQVLKKLTVPTRILLDFTGSYVDHNFTSEMKRVAKEYDSRIRKSASVGVTGFKRALAVAVNAYAGQGSKAGYFDNIEDAKDFLCE